MTNKTFYENPYLKKSTAHIIDFNSHNNRPYIILDRTIFYPEGGGQPYDLGKIGDFEIKDVQSYDEGIYHYIDISAEEWQTLVDTCKITIGQEVEITLDWKRRYDLMKQHAGQHLLSAILEQEYDTNTVGFHIGDDYMTIDIDQPLDTHQLEKAELLCNAYIDNAIEITAYYPDEETLHALPLRKAPSVSENIRIVEIKDFDYSPCGGLHPKLTSEIKLLKIRRVEKQKKGLRIDFLCGDRAFNDYKEKNMIINQLGVLLSVRPYEIIEHTQRIMDENNQFNKTIRTLKKELLEYKSQSYINDFETYNHYKISTFNIDGDMSDLKQIIQSIVNEGNRVVIGYAKQDGKTSLCLAKSKDVAPLNMGQLFKENIHILDGKGGGSPFMAQGGIGNVTIEQLQLFIQTVTNEIKNQL